MQESFVVIFGLFQCVQLAQKICENDWTKLNASKQTKGRRVLKSAQIWGIWVSPILNLDLISASWLDFGQEMKICEN